jgi:elongation factor Tu
LRWKSETCYLSTNNGDNGPVIQGSALGGLNNDPTWVPKNFELMEAVDAWIEEPIRDVAKPFLMPVEDVFSLVVEL